MLPSKIKIAGFALKFQRLAIGHQEVQDCYGIEASYGG